MCRLPEPDTLPRRDDAHRSRSEIDRRVDEDHGTCVSKIHRELRNELVQGDDPRPEGAEGPSKGSSDANADPIIAAQLVANSHHDEPGEPVADPHGCRCVHRATSPITAPSGARSSITSGICPRA